MAQRKRFTNPSTIIRFGAAANDVRVAAFDTKKGEAMAEAYDLGDMAPHAARQFKPFSEEAREERRKEKDIKSTIAAAICELHGIHGKPKRKHNHRHHRPHHHGQKEAA